jgi:hypothetical protein
MYRPSKKPFAMRSLRRARLQPCSICRHGALAKWPSWIQSSVPVVCRKQRSRPSSIGMVRQRLRGHRQASVTRARRCQTQAWRSVARQSPSVSIRWHSMMGGRFGRWGEPTTLERARSVGRLAFGKRRSDIEGRGCLGTTSFVPTVGRRCPGLGSGSDRYGLPAIWASRSRRAGPRTAAWGCPGTASAERVAAAVGPAGRCGRGVRRKPRACGRRGQRTRHRVNSIWPCDDHSVFSFSQKGDSGCSGFESPGDVARIPL